MKLPVLALCAWSACVGALADEASAWVTSYPNDFFARLQPYSAFDMLAALPGYTFSEGDADVRGFAAAGGNVLIDGARPVSKQETLETILRRIPASTVESIELIRSGAPGIDMQGRTVLANVVRVHGAQTRGSVEAGLGSFQRGFEAPRAAGELSHQRGAQRYELSGALYREWDDEHGVGDRPSMAPDGSVLRDVDYWQYEGSKIAQLGAGYDTALGAGRLRLNGAYQHQRFRADIVETELSPEPGEETGVESEDEVSGEVGLHYERPLGEQLALEVFGIRRDTDEDNGETSEKGDESSLFREQLRAAESVLRTTLRRTGERWTLEGGLEAALNTLESRTALTENGVDVPLPTARVRVEEKRAEAVVAATWRMAPAWTLESGLGVERSEISQSGDSQLTKSFTYPKPRALLSWTPTGNDRLRLLIEREVGQLDFEDFASSASLSDGTVTAGNPDLEPDRSWRAELVWERHFLQGAGAFVISLRHEEIEDLVDRIPVSDGEGGIFDAVGNIGSGTRDELELGLDLPLDRFGITDGLFKASVLWRTSEATDPATGMQRRISGDLPLEATLEFSRQLPFRSSRWGVEVAFETEEKEYQFDRIQTDRLGTRLDMFAELRPRDGWIVRLDLKNLTDRPAERTREIYDGMRGSVPLDYTDVRTLRIGPYVELAVRKTFGS